MKRTVLDPEGAVLIADLLFDLIRDEDVGAVGGLETGAIPIVAAVCARSWPEKPIAGFRAQGSKGPRHRPADDGLLEKSAELSCSRM